MINKKDLQILSYLRKNARMNLTKMSRLTGIPVSTIFDKLKLFQKEVVRKHTTLVDFENLGYSTRANIILKSKKDKKAELRDYLMRCEHVNSMYRISNGYDYMIECIFRNIKEMEEFTEMLEDRFDVEDKKSFYLIDDLRKESFLADNLELLRL